MAKPTLNPPNLRFVADLSLDKDLNFRLARRGEGVEGGGAAASAGAGPRDDVDDDDGVLVAAAVERGHAAGLGGDWGVFYLTSRPAADSMIRQRSRP